MPATKFDAEVPAMPVTVNAGVAFLPDGSSINLLSIQSALNSAWQGTGDIEFANAADELSRITRKHQGPHGEWLDGAYCDEDR